MQRRHADGDLTVRSKYLSLPQPISPTAGNRSQMNRVTFDPYHAYTESESQPLDPRLLSIDLLK